VIQIAAAIEDHLFDAFGDGLFCNGFSSFLCRRYVAATFELDARSRDQRLPGLIVDHLGIDVVERAVHVQTRPLSRSAELLADAIVNTLPDCISFVLRNHVFSHLSAEPPRDPVRILEFTVRSS